MQNRSLASPFVLLLVFVVLGVFFDGPRDTAVNSSESIAWAAEPADQGSRLREVSTSPLLPGWMLASFEKPEAPKYSVDGGHYWLSVGTAPWTAIPYGEIHVAMVPVENLPANPRFILGVDSLPYKPQNGLYRSGDLGTTWTRQTFDVYSEGCNTPDLFFYPGHLGFPALIVLPPKPRHIFANMLCFYDDPVASGGVQFSYLSHDRGVTWVEPDGELAIQALAVSPANPLHLYGYDSKWYESLDGGDTWSPTQFSIDYIYYLAVGKGDVLYGLEPGSPDYTGARSPDGGQTWTFWDLPQYCLDGSPVQLLAHATFPGVLLARCRTYPGGVKVFRSLDGGDTWSQIDAPAGDYLALDYGHPGRLLGVSDCTLSSPTLCGGLWYSDDGATTWAQLTTDFSEPPHQAYLPRLSLGLSLPSNLPSQSGD